MEKTGQRKRGSIWAHLAGVALSGLLLGGVWLVSVPLRTGESVVTVTLIDAPTRCRAGIQMNGRTSFRSEPPANPEVLGYCGGVVTDQGFFRLPHSMVNFFPNEGRASLLDRLEQGCRYKIATRGPGGFGATASAPTITHLREAMGCG